MAANDVLNDGEIGSAELGPAQQATFEWLTPRSRTVVAHLSRAEQERYLRTVARVRAMFGCRSAAER